MNLAWLRRAGRVVPPDVRFKAYFRVLNTPLLGPTYMLARRPLRPNGVTARTELVLDGYSRSANTYSRFAVDHVNPGRQVSSHTHTPRTIIRGVARGRPCIVLLRDPRDAVPPLPRWMPGLTASSALGYYIRYYSRLMFIKADLVVAPFEAVRADLGPIIDECNDRFGCSFIPCPPTPDNERAVRECIARLSRRNSGGELRETSIARPSKLRLQERAVHVRRLEAERELYAKSIDVYERFGSNLSPDSPSTR